MGTDARIQVMIPMLGEEEAQAVHAWCAGLSPREYSAWCSRQLNRPPVAPYLVLVERV